MRQGKRGEEGENEPVLMSQHRVPDATIRFANMEAYRDG